MSGNHVVSQKPTAAMTTPPDDIERDVLASRLAYLTVGLPALGTVGAVVYALSDGLWVSDIVLFAVMYLLTSLGVEAGLHRYFTHRSFEASEPVKVRLLTTVPEGPTSVQLKLLLLVRESKYSRVGLASANVYTSVSPVGEIVPLVVVPRVKAVATGAAIGCRL